MNFINQYFCEAKQIIDQIDQGSVLKMVELLSALKKNGGRLFILTDQVEVFQLQGLLLVTFR